MKRILLADSDSAARKALALLLNRKLGPCQICEVADGEALDSQLASCRPDLLLLDWSLPGRPARDACLRLHEANPQMQLVILSVNADDAAEAPAIGAGFIYKGAPAEQVLEQLRALSKPA